MPKRNTSWKGEGGNKKTAAKCGDAPAGIHVTLAMLAYSVR